MEVTVCGTAEYVLFLIGLCGEIETEEIMNLEGTSRDWNMKVINRLLKDKLVNKHTYDAAKFTNPKEVLRLRDAKGVPALTDLSPELISHYDLIRGKRGNRNKGDLKQKDRTRRASKLCYALYKTGMPVDMFTHEQITAIDKYNLGENNPSQNSYIKPKTIFSDEGELLKPVEIISRLGVNDEMYFSSKALSRMNIAGDDKANNKQSKAQGMIVKGNHFLPVYYFQSGCESWNHSCEESMMFTTNNFKRDLGRAITSEKGESILFVEEKKAIAEFIYPGQKVRNQVKPEGVYEKAYTLPLDQNHEDMRRMILTENFQERCNEILLGEYEVKGQKHDGVKDDRKIYNLLSCDLVKIKRILGEMEEGRIAIIIHAWQVEIINTLLGKDIMAATTESDDGEEKDELQVIIIDESEFSELVDSL